MKRANSACNEIHEIEIYAYTAMSFPYLSMTSSALMISLVCSLAVVATSNPPSASLGCTRTVGAQFEKMFAAPM
jgi:hypothetical protein